MPEETLNRLNCHPHRRSLHFPAVRYRNVEEPLRRADRIQEFELRQTDLGDQALLNPLRSDRCLILQNRIMPLQQPLRLPRLNPQNFDPTRLPRQDLTRSPRNNSTLLPRNDPTLLSSNDLSRLPAKRFVRLPLLLEEDQQVHPLQQVRVTR